MPAYNEQEGIGGFIGEIAASLSPLSDRLEFVVVDDRSKDGTVAALEALQGDPRFSLTVVASPVNRGHGPTALEAYATGVALATDVIVHVDGDGQFLGRDFPALVAALDGVDGVHGVRVDRTDPWFRKALSGLVRGLVLVGVHRRIADVNTPLRAYRPATVAALLAAVPADSLVPHVHFSILEKRLGLSIREVKVTSIPRRGSVQSGTMWGETTKEPKLPPRSLVVFAAKAAREVVRVHVTKTATKDRTAVSAG